MRPGVLQFGERQFEIKSLDGRQHRLAGVAEGLMQEVLLLLSQRSRRDVARFQQDFDARKQLPATLKIGRGVVDGLNTMLTRLPESFDEADHLR